MYKSSLLFVLAAQTCLSYPSLRNDSAHGSSLVASDLHRRYSATNAGSIERRALLQDDCSAAEQAILRTILAERIHPMLAAAGRAAVADSPADERRMLQHFGSLDTEVKEVANNWLWELRMESILFPGGVTQIYCHAFDQGRCRRFLDPFAVTDFRQKFITMVSTFLSSLFALIHFGAGGGDDTK